MLKDKLYFSERDSQAESFDASRLLFRREINLENALSAEYYRGRCVLVTGGGGSIGSELCRRLASVGVGRLVVFDIYENNAYELEQELRREYGDALHLDVRIGSIRDPRRLSSLFDELKPDAIFHAAAHKHVPLMEANPAEAVKNNIFGTLNVILAAEKSSVQKLVIISSDKAVNPTSVMGATKRFCELLAKSRTGEKTKIAAVRFGNVLGSHGSVIPLFRRQIEDGGPITVTDKRITRYFMTAGEAASLVLEAGAMANHGELYVLDMGEPVRIFDLARRMAELSGRDIEIVETGLRPGEKLYEELLVKPDGVTKTKNRKIFIENGDEVDAAEVMRHLEELSRALDASDEVLVSTLKKAVL